MFFKKPGRYQAWFPDALILKFLRCPGRTVGWKDREKDAAEEDRGGRELFVVSHLPDSGFFQEDPK